MSVMKCKLLLTARLCKKCFSTAVPQYTATKGDTAFKIAVIGSGPAGFYTSQQLLKNPDVTVDIYERLPVPFGLVRYGVAPDHPEVKNVINTFTNTAKNDRCNFFGNVEIGKDISFSHLRKAYHATVLSYGADSEKQVGVPGEHLPDVLSARRFVGWYNGCPGDENLNPNLKVETVAVIGQGNVALDVARILLSPIDKLKSTDITDYCLQSLSESLVKRVVVIGRRGPLEVAFTIKELRELTNLEGVASDLNPEDFVEAQKALASLPRPRKRLVDLMIQTSKKAKSSQSREFSLKFLRSPVRINANGQGSTVKNVELCINRLEKQGDSVIAVPTEHSEILDCGLVLKSIGYGSVAIDSEIPFDKSKGLIPNDRGRVKDAPGVYCSGWVKTGPVGVIVNTMNSSFETGQCVLEDLTLARITEGQKPGSELVQSVLKEKGVRTVSFDQWLKINDHEQKQGKAKGKLGEKIVSVNKMLEIAFS